MITDNAILAHAVPELVIAKTYLAAVFAILLWDFVCAFHLEYQRIWCAKWSTVKIQYVSQASSTVLCRYLNEPADPQSLFLAHCANDHHGSILQADI